MAAVEYRAYAARCATAAAQTVDADNKAMLIELVAAWLRLAELAEKYGLTSTNSPPLVE